MRSLSARSLGDPTIVPLALESELTEVHCSDPTDKEDVEVHINPVNGSSQSFASFLCAWKYDVVLCLLSLVSMMALACLLLYEHGKLQRDWIYGPITLNGVTSILATTSRTALIVPTMTALSQEKWTWFAPATMGDSNTGRPLSDFIVSDAASRSLIGSVQLLWLTNFK